MKKAILIQARLSSERFPGKMLKKIGEYTLVEYVYNRCLQSKNTDEVAILTSNQFSDDLLVQCCLDRGIQFFRGSLDNVLERYINGAESLGCDVICRVCGDSPFVDVEKIDEMFNIMENGKINDYISITGIIPGFLSEVFKTSALKKSLNSTFDMNDLEHVTRYIRNNLNSFNITFLKAGMAERKLDDIQLTIDYPKDLELANEILKFGRFCGFQFSSQDIIDILKSKINLSLYRRKYDELPNT